MSGNPFDPPAGDLGLLQAAARMLGTVGGELAQDLTRTTSGVRGAVAHWTGQRRIDFEYAAGGAQVQLRVAGDGCTDVGRALNHYATVFAQTVTDVADYKRSADTVQSDATLQAGKLDPNSAQSELLFQHSGAQVAALERAALEAKTSLRSLAGRTAAVIDAVVDKVAPVSESLSPEEIRRRVNAELGLTGLTSAGAPSTAQAWAQLIGAQRAVPGEAINADGSVDFTAAFAVVPVPPAGSSPAFVNLWWNNLSPTEQDAVLRQRSAQVGNLDGVPAVDRDFANRRNLSAIRTNIQGQIDALRSQEPTKYETAYQGYREYQMISPGWQQWNDKVNALKTRLDGMNDVVKALASPAPAPLFLLGIQDTGHGRAIIATGNPDTAANVATYVPGMGTKLTGIQGGVSRSIQMYNAAQYAGSTSTATVTWYGYDAPQSLGPAASEDDAKAAAPLLDSFVSGLRVTHDGAFHSTVVSHSYGTTVTGEAASHGRSLDVDDVVFVASPGVTVDHASDLHLTGGEPGSAEHVYATTAEYDPIRLAEGINGGAPVHSDFGSHEFRSNPDRGHWYELGWNTAAHSAYWDRGNPSLRSMGMVIAGSGQDTR